MGKHLKQHLAPDKVFRPPHLIILIGLKQHLDKSKLVLPFTAALNPLLYMFLFVIFLYLLLCRLFVLIAFIFVTICHRETHLLVYVIVK